MDQIFQVHLQNMRYYNQLFSQIFESVLPIHSKLLIVHFHFDSNIFISNSIKTFKSFIFSGHQTSNSAKLGKTFQMGG